MIDRKLNLDAVAPEVAPRIRLLPIVHERVDLAAVVRMVLQRVQPAAVAVELPTTLAELTARAVARLPEISLLVSESDDDEDALVWPVTPADPTVEAIRWAVEQGIPWFCIDPDVRYRERHRDPVPDPWSLWRLGVERYLGLLLRLSRARSSDADSLREQGLAFHLAECRDTVPSGTILGVLGAAHVAPVAHRLAEPLATPLARTRRSDVHLRNLHPSSLTALLPDPPITHAVWELVRDGTPPEAPDLETAVNRPVSVVRHGLRLITGQSGSERRDQRWRVVELAAARMTRLSNEGDPVPDRTRLPPVAWSVAASSWTEHSQRSIHHWQRRVFFDFARRYARVQGILVPSLYECIVAARGVADDNLAWEMFDVLRCHPWQREDSDIETVEVDGESLDLGTRTIRFRRRFFRVKQRPVAIPVRQRPESPEDPGEWIEGFGAHHICSYPPEDIRVEDYGRFLQQKVLALLSAERTRTEPFTTSLLDGVDLRETIRNAHEGRVYVREQLRAPGQAGSVVVVFDRDLTNERYPFTMTWLGEHDQESDMAFYATDPTEQVVGPGIMRAVYGGFMLTMPRGRLLDIWHDPDYRMAREKPEVLLMAAVDYSPERLIVHLAPDPPSSRVHQYAAVQSKAIVHIPIGSMSPTALDRIRTVHLLAGYHLREHAGQYIW
jgi:hypothetical protein